MTSYSYEQNVAASLHANELCAKLFGRENVNTTDACIKIWMQFRDEYLAAQTALVTPQTKAA
jgi:hypothetical protein